MEFNTTKENAEDNAIKNTFSCNKYLARGKSHISNNIPCQDYCDFYVENDFSIIALSDGAGSCKYSHFGSKLIVERIIAFFCQNHNEIFQKDSDSIKDEIIKHLSIYIEKEAEERGVEEKELSATLLFVCCYKDKFIYGHIGDGVICCDFNNNLKVISRGSGGEFKGETIFFRKNISKEYFALSIEKLEKSMLSFYCFSDGLEPVFVANKGGELANILQKFSLWIYKYSSDVVAKNLCSTLDEIAESNHNIYDDLSLVIMNIDNSETKNIRDRQFTVEAISQILAKHNERLHSDFSNKLDLVHKELDNIAICVNDLKSVVEQLKAIIIGNIKNDNLSIPHNRAE